MDKQDDSETGFDLDRLAGALECLLFAAPDPLPMARLADLLECPPDVVRLALEGLEGRLDGGGLQVIRLAGGIALGTRREYAEYVQRLREPPPERLSAAALEVLAIVGYRQPVTRAEVDAIRGVDSSGSLRTLVEKGLVAVQGRKQAPGRPMLFVTTEQFLRTFGLQDLSDLPDVPGAFCERARQLTLEDERQARSDAPAPPEDEAPDEAATGEE